MTGRQKIIDALSPRGTPHTPIVLCYPEIFLRDHWDQVCAEPWWAMHDPDPVLGVQIQRQLLAVTGEDRYRLWLGTPRDTLTRYRLEGQGADEARRVDTVTGKVELLLRPPPGGFVSAKDASLESAPPITSREQIDQLLPLPNEETRESLAADGRDEKPRLLREAFGRTHLAWTQISTPLDPLPFVFGFANFMVALADAPDLVRYAAERALAVQLRRVRTWQAAGVELFFLQECHGDLFSPAMYRDLFLPLTQELTRAIRSAGLLSIHYFCGNPNDRLDLLLQTGADALGLEESKKGFAIDMAEIAARVDGRMALVGNLDAIHLLEHGRDEDVRREVARQLAAGRRNAGRFLFGIGSPVTPGTPASRVRALADWVHELAP